ncbi:MAG: DUF3102 domain-containing protein, partial [Rubripirellula sp.]|nr:DUF3102 domain-containing protein [Rubripirellula sp.]
MTRRTKRSDTDDTLPEQNITSVVVFRLTPTTTNVKDRELKEPNQRMDDQMTTVITAELSALADKANHSHQLATEAARSAIQHAIECGGYLQQVKDSLPHGEFGRWLADEFQGSERSAQRYMKFAANKDRIEGATTTREATRMLADPEESKSDTVADLPRETCGGLPVLFESLDALTADIEQLTAGHYLSHYEPAGAMFVFPSTKEVGKVWFTFCALDHVDRGEDHFVWFPFVGPHDPGVIAIFAHDFGIRAGDFITYENRSQKDPSESTAGLLMASQEVKAGIKHSKTNGDSTTTKPETKSHPSGTKSETSVRP